MPNIPDAPWIRNGNDPADYPPCPCCGSVDYDFIVKVLFHDEYFCSDCCRSMEPWEFQDAQTDL